MPSTVSGNAQATPRIWPITAQLVTLAVLLMLGQGFLAGFTVASFFGDTPSRGDYVSAAVACLTTLPAFAAMVWCGRQRGCRSGLWVIGAPAGIMGLTGLNLLITPGDSRDPDPGRWSNLADWFGGSTWFNWVVTAVLVAVAVSTRQRQRRTRHTAGALDA